MICQWCATREAKWWGQPFWGPQSRMCDPCRERVCKRDVQAPSAGSGQAGKVVFMAEEYSGQEKTAGSK